MVLYASAGYTCREQIGLRASLSVQVRLFCRHYTLSFDTLACVASASPAMATHTVPKVKSALGVRHLKCASMCQFVRSETALLLEKEWLDSVGRVPPRGSLRDSGALSFEGVGCGRSGATTWQPT